MSSPSRRRRLKNGELDMIKAYCIAQHNSLQCINK